MNYSILSWENHLISLAIEALDSYVPEDPELFGNQKLLDEAYKHCERITQIHSKTFYLASRLLPEVKRKATRALYAFCRISDDLVDRSGENVERKLEEWRQMSISNLHPANDAVALAWNDARYRFQIPWRYAEQLICGVSRDLFQTRYQTFEELATYCYGVACTVGLMSMHIIGYSGAEAIPYAIRLGVALQMTNILRDIGEDWRLGRLYLPQDELSQFNLGEGDISRGKVTSNWREFMKFQINRNRRIYQEALPGISLLNSDGRFAIGAAAELYQAILRDIEDNDYDVFNRRASINKFEKLWQLPGIWWRVNHSGYA